MAEEMNGGGDVQNGGEDGRSQPPADAPVSWLLSLRGVSKAFTRGENRLPVLTDVSFGLAGHEIVAVAGSKDCGKTTLLRIAAGIERPDAGEVWFDGRELTGHADIKRVRLLGSEIAWRGSSQARRSRLLGREIAWTDRKGPGTRLQIRDFVGLPLTMGRRRGRREVRGLAEEALERVGVAGAAGQRWEELSNWERVLVAIARGIVSHPRLLIADDLLEGLRMRRMHEIGDLLHALVGEIGCTVLMSAPDLDAALVADRVWSFTPGGLALMSDQTSVGSAKIIDFPRAPRQGGGSCGVGL
jgi:putative ABC transport system ATP-binding protein